MPVLDAEQLLFLRLEEHALAGDRVALGLTLYLLDMRVSQVVSKFLDKLRA